MKSGGISVSPPFVANLAGWAGESKSRAWKLGQAGRILALPPLEKRNGVATSSSPWEEAWEGNEDVAAPIGLEAASRCAKAGRPEKYQRLM